MIYTVRSFCPKYGGEREESFCGFFVCFDIFSVIHPLRDLHLFFHKNNVVIEYDQESTQLDYVIQAIFDVRLIYHALTV
jgi:hypothetical protein